MKAVILAALLLAGSLAGCAGLNDRPVQTGDLEKAQSTIVAAIHEDCG